MRLVWTAALLALAATAAQAEPAGEYEGKWVVRWAGDSGRAREAQLDLQGETGTWRLLVASVHRGGARTDPCDAATHPVAVEKATPKVLVVAIQRSNLAGCRDGKLVVNPAAGGKLEGRMGSGIDVVVERRQ